MKKKISLSEEDQTLFRQLMTGTRQIKQDTIVHRPQRKKVSEVPVKRLIQEQADASHYFSDEFQPLLNTEGAVKYVRADVSHFELKKLRRGDYSPELFLDLHGLTQMQAKQELGALIAACRREHVFCACVMHGHGKHILKQQTPLWLAQHPHVMAFHQAPKEYGGDAALLVLIEVEEWQPPELPERQAGGWMLPAWVRFTSDSFRHLQIAGAHLPVEDASTRFREGNVGNGRGAEHWRRFARAEFSHQIAD